ITPELGILYPADGKVLTDDNGKAAADILPGSNAGKAIVTARYGEYSASLNFTTLGDQPKLSLRLVNENGYIINMVSADSPARLEAVLTDDFGKPVFNEIIKFGATTGILSPADGLALTDRTGKAYVTLSAGSKPGPGTASAEHGEDSAKLNFVTTGDDIGVVNISLRLITPDGKNIISKDSPGQLEAILTDSDRNPLPNQVIAFKASLGVIEPEAATSLTDEEGRAYIRLSAGSKPGAGSATATFGEYSSESVSFYTEGDQVGETGVTLSLRLLDNITGNPLEKIGIGTQARLVASLRDADDKPVSAQSVTFTTTAGHFQPIVEADPLPTVRSEVTNTEGQAAVILFAGTTAGKGVVTAVFGQESVSLNFIIE
ncbi:MAG: hypothetical protein BWK80_46000, partial [Desulfobacteraceae bacterium IS3]